MPIDHSSCGHPRTPKDRAACRRQQSSQTPRNSRLFKALTADPDKQPNDYATPTLARELAEKPRKARGKARPDVVTYERPSGRYGALRALSNAPSDVQSFVETCETRGFTMNEVAVDRGFSIEVYSSRGAGRVTWDGDEIAWFTRLGYTSITTRVNSAKHVWKALGVVPGKGA